MAMDENAGDVLLDLLGKATKKWSKQKEREIKNQNAYQWRRSNLRAVREWHPSMKDAAERVMHDSYMKASSNGTLPAHARQIMYIARPLILEITKKDKLDDAYFTQKLLPDYIAEHGIENVWDVVYDARGHIEEPHTGLITPLGTLDVRDYIGREPPPCDEVEIGIAGGNRFPTIGPVNRFSAVLFIEKEGFLPLLKKVKLAERFDLAIMSTKGMSNIASRRLIDALGVPVYVLHDLDVSGFTILNTLRDSTDRYFYTSEVEVIDVGLRLEDVEEYALQPEPVRNSRNWSLTGITDAEQAFLSKSRVELNAFTSADFVKWIEKKLKQYGVKKVVPDETTLVFAYRRQVEVNLLGTILDDARESAHDTASKIQVPKKLAARVAKRLKKQPELAWDDAIREASAKLRRPQGHQGKV